MPTPLWPTYGSPADLVAIEQVPLAERGLPESTYHLVLRAAELWPDAPAMSVLPDAARWQEPARFDFAAVSRRVTRFANAFVTLGVERRTAIAFLSPNCADLAFALLAAEAVGIAAPLNPALSIEHGERLLAVAGARILVAAGPELSADVWAKARALAVKAGVTTLLALRPTAPRASPALEPLPGVEIAYLADRDAPDDALVVAPPRGADLASYFHTGGTTGLPKLAAHTHANEVADAWMIAAGEFLGEGATFFGALPLFHVNALVVTLLSPLFKGQHVVWAGPLGYREPMLYGVFWRLVERYRIEAMSAVPTVYAALAQVPVDANIATLHMAIVGAAPLPPAVRAAFHARTGIALCQGYGLTEATCASARSFPDHPRDDAVGQRLPYQEIQAMRIDPSGARIPLPPGESGVICIRGPAVFPGYLVPGPDGPVPDATGKVVDGWLDTGDLGSVDLDGFLRLGGRAKDIIIRGGHNIDPAAIEDALLAHPQIAAASAVGSPDPHAGEVPVAYVVLRGAVDGAELLRWAAEHVPERSAAPKHVFVVPALPVTEIGKPFKPELRRDATQRAVDEALGAGVATARLVDGNVVVEVTAATGAIRDVLDRYPITWRVTA